jgi:DNA-binding NarL/FixJ family response regulator
VGARGTSPAVERVDVVIVEDHGLLAQMLAHALGQNGLAVERCTELTETRILATVEAADAEVVLLDLDVGGELGSTVQLIPEIDALGPKVVMLTGVTDRVRLAECIEAGAVGVMAKSQPFEELVAAVGRARSNGTLLSDYERQELLAELRRHRASEQARLEAFERFTPRDRQALAAMMDGQSADEIAQDWVVSVTTVRSQIRSVLQKLGVNSQLSAVAFARKAGWEPDEA